MISPRTAEELHRPHPNILWSGHRSVGRIYSRFQEDESVLDKPRAGRMTQLVVLAKIAVIR
jgi:hypothetical protein